MSKEMLKSLIDIIDEKDIDTLFKVLIRFVPEEPATQEELMAIAEADKSIMENGTISHEAISW